MKIADFFVRQMEGKHGIDQHGGYGEKYCEAAGGERAQREGPAEYIRICHPAGHLQVAAGAGASDGDNLVLLAEIFHVSVDEILVK